MQKCPRCELLLIDTDAECPRCHAAVTQIITPEQAEAKKEKDMEAWRLDAARRTAGGDYIPPLLPPLSVPVAALAFAAGFVCPQLFSNSALQPSLWEFIGGMAVAVACAIVAKAGGLYVALYFMEHKRPGIDRTLYTASMMTFLSALVMLAITWIPGVSSTGFLVVWAALSFVSIRAMFELGFNQALPLVVLCVLADYIAVRMGYGSLGPLLKTSGATLFF